MFTIKSQRVFDSKMEDLIAEWSLYKDIAAKIVVPPEMIWWYWQEFGTAAFAERSPSYPGYDVPQNTDPTITLRFQGRDGKLVLTKHVFTTGVPAKHMVTSIQNDIRVYAFTRIREVLKASNYNPAGLEEALLTDIMVAAKDMITASFADNLSEHADRQFGRLQGATAADEFAQSATIESTTV